jgi:hypothetical protein
MNKEFIPYEQALALKELGFDEPCLMYWNDFGKTSINRFQLLNKIDEWCQDYIEAPLYQQAFRWFREKYNLKGHVEAVEYLDGTPNTYHWCIFNKYNSGYDQLTYEEAELECLRKLIEIVKNK